MDYLNYFLFGIYPYIVLAIFVVGSIFRFVYMPLDWKSSSSELLEKNQLRVANNLFHIGILALFLGHLGGLLTPHFIFGLFGLTDKTHQIIEIYAGSVSGIICIVGVFLLIIRRFFNDYIYYTSTTMDFVVLLWILLTVAAGLMSVPYSYLLDKDGQWLVKFANYAQSIVLFKANASNYLNGIPFIYKLHIFMGLTLFLLLPFSRLVHVFSGFSIVFSYPKRAMQIVRRYSTY
ncbi:MAG: respiratory nitrate reductase subunit gamma [Desulfurella sp.]|uniref:respiratory nitrate reductase subunit gamma n=1 Tax=Desulfurella sp. TaxID=1962857 RepID=UPI003D115FF5